MGVMSDKVPWDAHEFFPHFKIFRPVFDIPAGDRLLD